MNTDTETRLLKLEEQVVSSTMIITELKDQIVRQSDIIAKLICGLYNCETQKNYRKLLLDILEGDTDFVQMEGVDSSRWDIDPTTSQGDELEDVTENLKVRINHLCLRLADLEDFLPEDFISKSK